MCRIALRKKPPFLLLLQFPDFLATEKIAKNEDQYNLVWLSLGLGRACYIGFYGFIMAMV